MNARTQHGGAEADAPTPEAGAARGWVKAPGYHVFHVSRRTPDADVYLAYHRPTQTFRDLIVVQRAPDATRDADEAHAADALRRSVEAEVSAASAVRHPGVAPVEEVGFTTDGRLFVAAARPVGRTLREVLAEDGALRPGRRAVDLGLSLADALAAAHERGVVHGWLSPDSVILVTGREDEPERLVVLGLGTAAAQGAAVAPGTLPPDVAPFTSPERAAGAPRTLRDDVFSLGAVIQSMFTGAPPPAVRAGLGEQSAPSPNPVAAVLQQARAADPARRYTSAWDVAAALRAVGDPGVEPPPEAYAGGAGQRVRPAAASAEFTATLPRPHGAPPSVGRRRLALAAAGALGLVAVAGTSFAWRRRAELAVRSPAPAVPRERAAPVQQVPLSAAASPVASAPPVPGPTPPPGPSLAAALPAPPTPPAEPALTPPAPPPAAAAPATSAAASPPRTAPREPRVAAATPAAASPRPAASTTSTAGAPSAPAVVTAAGEVAAERSGRERPAAEPAAAGSAPASPAGATPVAGANLTGAYAALTEYLGAIEARDLDRLARAYPAMTEQQRRAWATFFGSVANFRPQLVVDQISPSGATARAHVRGAYEYENLRPRRAERQPVSFNITLARDGAGWRVQTVE